MDFSDLAELGVAGVCTGGLIVLIYYLATMVCNKFDEMDRRHAEQMRENTDRYTELINRVEDNHIAERKDWKESNERSRERLNKSMDELTTCIKRQTVIIEQAQQVSRDRA